MAYTPRAESDNYNLEKEKELYASLYPHAGVPVNPETGEAIRPEQQGLLDQQVAEEEEEESSYPSPIAMGLLGAGASMLRQSGWRDTPITLGEQIGHAIPHGIRGYYQQDMLNQQEQAAVAQAQKVQEEEEDERKQRSNFIKYMKDSGIPERKFELFLLKYDQSPENALQAIDAWHEEQKKMTPEQEDAAFKGMLEFSADHLSLDELKGFQQMTPAMFPNRLEELRGFLKKKLGLLWREKDFQAEHEFEKQKEETRKGEHAQEQEQILKEFTLKEYKTHEEIKLAAKDYALRESGQNIKFQLEERKVDLQGKKVDIDVAQLKQDNDQFMLKLEQQGKFKESDLERQDRHLAIQEQALEHKIKNEDARLVLDQTKHTDNFGLEEEKLTKTFALEEEKLLLSKEKFGWSKEKFDEEHGFAKEKFEKEHGFTVKKFEQTHQIAVQRTAAEILKWGQENNIDQERIKIKLQELHQKNEHHLGDMDFKNMVHHATVQNKAKDLAFRVVQFENLKDQQKTQHSQWQAGHDQTLKEHVAWVENEARKANAGEKNLKLKEKKVADAREFFYAELEFEKAKIREQKMLQPKKLVGQDALNWAEENNPEVFNIIKDKKNHQVIHLDKYGNYDKVSEIPSGLLSKTQMDQVYKIQKDYTQIPAIKDANKIASLLVSLKNLAAQRKVTDPTKSSGVAEFAMIYKFMKSLDETSTVLASEFRNASHAGRSFFANVGVAFQKQWDGVQLGESQKTEILNSVKAVAYAKLTEVVTPQYASKLLAMNKLGGLPEEEAKGFLVNPLYDYFERFPEDKIKSKLKETTPEDDTSETIHNDS